MSPDAAARTIMHLTDERDTLAAELAALRVRHSDALKSFVAQTEIAVRAMAERDAALAAIERVRALHEGWHANCLEDGQHWPCDTTKALEPAQDVREGTSKATGGETGSRITPTSFPPRSVAYRYVQPHERQAMSPMFRKTALTEASRWFKNGDHPDDGSHLIHLTGTTEAFLSEGKVVRLFRHPNFRGDEICSKCAIRMHDHGWIDTLEDGHNVCPGDWIATGVQGEHWPIKPDVFAATYEAVDEAQR